MKNVLILLVCFAFAAVSANAQTGITPADHGTYIQAQGAGSIVVSAKGITDGTNAGSGGNSVNGRGGTVKNGPGSTGATGGQKVGVLSDVKQGRNGQWGGTYTGPDGKSIQVTITFNRKDNSVVLTAVRSGKVVAKYLRK